MSKRPDESENLGKFIFSNDPGTRKMGLAMAKGANSTESKIMIKALARWDPVLSDDAKNLIEELGIDSEWTEDDEYEIIDGLLKNNPSDILWFILDSQGVLTDHNSEYTPESAELDTLHGIIDVLADDETNKTRLLGLLNDGPHHYDIIFGVIRKAVEKKWEEVIPILFELIKDDWNDSHIKDEAREGLESFGKEAP